MRLNRYIAAPIVRRDDSGSPDAPSAERSAVERPGPTDRPHRVTGSQLRQPASALGNGLRLRCRVRLLTLAGDLDDLGVRCRLTDTISPPFTLRCWDPAQQGPVIEVACGPDRYGRLVFQAHPAGEVLSDAEEALEPGDTVDLARELARRLGIDPARCGRTLPWHPPPPEGGRFQRRLPHEEAAEVRGSHTHPAAGLPHADTACPAACRMLRAA